MGCAVSKAVVRREAFQASKPCQQICPCGHQCGGIAGETECLGCVQCTLPDASPCPVCLEELSTSPAVRLEGCGHVVHMDCVQELLGAIAWRGKEIQVAQLRCPAGCGHLVSHPALASRVAPLRALADKAAAAAEKQARADGADASDAETKYRIFQCNECAAAYVGGRRECGVAEEGSEARALCDGCRGRKTGICWKHGAEYTAYKCNYCCQAATFTCGGGGERFCTTCHIGAAKMFHEGRWSEWQREAIKRIPPCDPSRCPFGGAHPKGRTHAWHAPCAKCYLAKGDLAIGTAVERPSRAHKRCETPGCAYAASNETAGWNALGRHCCAGCMKHGSYSTMAANPAAPPHECHDHGRCKRVPFNPAMCGECV